jgi:hypothetical protein
MIWSKKMNIVTKLKSTALIATMLVLRGVAIFAKACFGHPSPSKRQKLNATANVSDGLLFCRSLSDSEGGDKIKGHPTRRPVIWSQCSDPAW